MFRLYVFIQMFPTYLSTTLLLGHYKNVNRPGCHDMHIHFMYYSYINLIGLMMTQ
jgi:hypothetical protein